MDKIEEMDDGKIYLKNQQVRYTLRPEALETLFIARYMVEYKLVYVKRKTGNHLAHGDSGSENDDLKPSLKLKMEHGSGKFKKLRIIESFDVGFGIMKDREAHFLEQLLLYYPYRNDCDEHLLGNCSTFEERYNEVKATVDQNRQIFKDAFDNQGAFQGRNRQYATCNRPLKQGYTKCNCCST